MFLFINFSAKLKVKFDEGIFWVRLFARQHRQWEFVNIWKHTENYVLARIDFLDILNLTTKETKHTCLWKEQEKSHMVFLYYVSF